MDNSLWGTTEPDPNENRSLAKFEQQFLLTGDPGEESVSEMRGRLSDKAKELPDRMQQLIDDISLLYYHGYLEDNEGEIWEGLLSISNRSQVVRESPVVRTAHQRSGPELDLGFEIGSMISMLHEEPVPVELVWGIIIGLVGEADDNWEREAENLVKLFEELENYYETRLVSAGTVAHEDDDFQEERNEIREILMEQGFSPAPPLVNAIIREYAGDETGLQLEYTVNRSSSDPDPESHPKPPVESPTAEDFRRTNLESIISRLAKQTQLQSIDRLAKDLREDAFTIQSKELWSVNLDSIICYIGENGETHIQNFDDIKANQKSKSHALNVLSSKDTSKVCRPATQEDPEATWSLTSYGKLLYKTRIEYNCSINWIYNLVANPERLDDDTRLMVSRVIEDGSEL